MRPAHRLILALLAACAPLSSRADTGTPASEIVQFAGPSIAGSTVELAGRLVTPAGAGPFPALVLLHGCDGMDLASDWVARDFGSWGYVLLALDSFGPRGVTEACTDYVRVSPSVRAKDAHAARAYLASLPFVDAGKIGVLGWSHGGITVLEAIANPYLNEPTRSPPPSPSIPIAA